LDCDYLLSDLSPLRSPFYTFLTPYALSLTPNKNVSEKAISRVLFPERVTRLRDNDHSSSLDVTVEIKRPTRELGRTTLSRSPIWFCSRWGLPSPRRHRRDWWALTSPFHPYPVRQKPVWRGGFLSVALSFPSPGLGVTQHLVLRSPDFPPPWSQGGGHLSYSDTLHECL